MVQTGPDLNHNTDPADNLTVFWAFGPDQPDLPIREGRGGGGGGGREGSGREGGFPCAPGPGGVGAGAAVPSYIDNKLFEQSPDIFTRQ